MFDVYVHAHEIDPRARHRMMGLVCVATLVTATSLGSALVGERLGVSRVGAPTIESLLVLPMDQPPLVLVPPPPAPVPEPKPVVDSQAPPQRDDPPDRDEPDLAELEEPSPPHESTQRTGTDTDLVGDGPIDLTPSTTALPCLVSATCSTSRPRPPTPPKPDAERTFQSIDVARERALASPDPAADQLARTPAGLARRNASSTVSFCIGTDGKTTDVRTRTSAGDRDVDRICRETVARRWRFQAFAVDGRARTTCSEVTFQIAFE